ncbi:UDP-2,4-diacetamido-2,4,6-trideoxy-beta-L-altropyranose hydrolase [Thiohalocapsa halophila]|uniref:UDP-2,4-diacetamido-2,4, 6-trideoxy-beta-L-altropyranose hydrolase n=1 Tax=Thiohalocapsa halophila TaxID=69359 RepID=A0ABS1CNJ1_9GAMM|nr:UDP-2,4-diacetamido-2,4,6-trideoxy-beta-L-altropyranose hydrolase [Thiohalocapsa halophila]MBK1633380.1 UDP-2,4-diacetamido-2,4,6-trideoxy-beta-L-altropyranose hydrolase [Thiohalocapsa halophila]
MNIALRTDASARIGLGHLARCRTLARALREAGATGHFICRAHPGHQIDALRAEGYRVSALPSPPLQQQAADADYAAWLGVSQTQDAAETITALTNNQQPKTNILIIDHYALDSTWEQRLRPTVDRILVIDDLANRRHECELLLDQNFTENAAERYRGLVPAHARLLLGPSYALLRPEYAQARQALRARDGAVRRVLVFFGGTDPDNLTGRALAALSDPALAHLALDVVVGANNPHADSLAAQAAARGNTQLHPPRPHLADLMTQADLAIGAGGATTWERCCLVLPSLVVSIAENQRPACLALADAGLIDYLGHKDRVTTDRLRRALQALLDDPEQRQHLAAAGAALVDGRGVERVVRHLLGAQRSH